MSPRFYIIMREDLWDCNPGKSIAQGAHAQADFDNYVENRYTNADFRTAHLEWSEDRNFGTTVVLAATLEQMHEIRTRIEHSVLTTDSSYPWRNWYGKMFTSNEITCMWAFVWKDEDLEYMKQYSLHP